ncbi:MAG: hypothetical protein GY803_26630 [Chloroflexi bacterium]|nr:hypothetical protein [Chloroflexota bacterium]
MSRDDSKGMDKRIGLIVGRDCQWLDMFMKIVNEADNGVVAELVRLSGTIIDDDCPYDVIIDRVSHEIPYYRAYLYHAALQGCYIINNPFAWSADSKFFGIGLVNRLGFTSPRTIVLPNKYVEKEMTPDNFRNLIYPMDWQGIIDYVGVPAIFKNIISGGRDVVYRVSSVDDLIRRYDESGTMTMLLQQIIDSDTHIHCFVFGHEVVLPLRFSIADNRYFPDILPTDDALGRQLAHQALTLTRAYGYDVNMVEFVLADDQLYIINATNPAPEMFQGLMTTEQFNFCVSEAARVAIARVKRPSSQHSIFDTV